MWFDVAVQTHPGFRKERNEDCFLALRRKGLFVVADGMSGHRHGELAARMAINTIEQFFESDEVIALISSQLKKAKNVGLEPNWLPLKWYELRRSFEEANSAIYLTATANPEFETMGTTLAGCLIDSPWIYIAHVGDSRVYRFRKQKLVRLTRDHSLLNRYVDHKLITTDQARHFPLRNVIVRAIGLAPEVEVDVSKRKLAAGDIFLLCTDGLTDMIKDSMVAEILSKEQNLNAACKQLVQAALHCGGYDNITVILVGIR